MAAKQGASPIIIVSGGQTGADRAALDFAIRSGLPHEGWCPRGRLAEDGPLSLEYQLRETSSERYAERTEWNVRDSDATVVFAMTAELRGGTQLTAKLAESMGKPLLRLAATEVGPLEGSVLLRQFLSAHRVTRLNVAGPRASQEPAIASFVDAVLRGAIVSTEPPVRTAAIARRRFAAGETPRH